MIANHAWLLPALPMVSAVVLLVAGRSLGKFVPWLAVLTTALPLGLAVPMLFQAEHRTGRGLGPIVAAHVIAPLGSLSVSASTSVDQLAALLCVVVTTVAFLVQLYSTAYMTADHRYPSYAAFVSLFTSAMLVVVLSSDLVWMLVGWEVMGICSYLLIGHHWEDKPNTDAAISAFMVTRFGDLGFTAGIATLAITAGSTQIPAVLGAERSTTVVTVASLLILLGVIGKSAQFPLQTWLPDAMAGPTPVSALIHAATMVAAGVYVLDRLSPVVLSTDVARNVLAVVAAITMLLAALCALAQEDLKRVLAWSTVSQLAYMYAALAVGAGDLGIAHLLTHAAFKALLFLGAGCVAHLVGSTLMSSMGGLRKSRLIAVCMTVGLATLGGFPFLSGYVSKDAILEHALRAWSANRGADWAALVIVIAGLATAAVTAAYCTRTWIRVFGGRLHEGDTHRVPARMNAPIVLLAVAALGLGAVLMAFGLDVRSQVQGYCCAPYEAASFDFNVRWLALSTAAAALGAGLILIAWRRQPELDPARVLGPSKLALREGLYFHEAYVRFLVHPARDGLARVTAAFDTRVIDGAVRGTGALTEDSGRRVRALHTGNAQLYLSVLVVGALVIAIGAASL